jgi:hypothetical protein
MRIALAAMSSGRCQGLVEHLNVLILDLFRWGAIFDCAWAWRRKFFGDIYDAK